MVAVGILAALKIWLSVVIFNGVNGIQGIVNEWLELAFNDNSLRNAFQLLEHSVSIVTGNTFTRRPTGSTRVTIVNVTGIK